MPIKSCHQYFLCSLVFVCVLTGGYWVSQLNGADTDIDTLKQSTILPEGFRQIPEFTMRSQQDKIVGRELFLDHWSLVFFGYIHCPDICSPSMVILKKARQLIAKSAPTATPQIVFVSIDPQRDTAGKLKSYLTYFDPSFIGLHGTESETQKLTHALGIAYKTGGDTDTNYLIDHSAAFLLIGPTGSLRAILSAPHDPITIASDYRAIVNAIL